LNSTSRTLTTVAVVFILIVVGVVAYFMGSKWHKKQVALSRQDAERECLEVVNALEEDLNATRAQLEAELQARADVQTDPEVFGTDTPGAVADDLTTDCEPAAAQIESLFKYLDTKPYLSEQGINTGSAAFLQENMALLLDKPPVNIAEMQNMFRLVKNMTHFYRVLGKERLLLLKEILTAEATIIEPAMAVFYAHVVECGNPLHEKARPASLERLYDYAGYFLNTLGGRSYLLRRESKVRMLVKYYSILIIDRANDEKFNRYGIDVRPYIDYLFYDISNQKGLANRERYLTRLTALRNKYL